MDDTYRGWNGCHGVFINVKITFRCFIKVSNGARWSPLSWEIRTLCGDGSRKGHHGFNVNRRMKSKTNFKPTSNSKRVETTSSRSIIYYVWTESHRWYQTVLPMMWSFFTKTSSITQICIFHGDANSHSDQRCNHMMIAQEECGS